MTTSTTCKYTPVSSVAAGEARAAPSAVQQPPSLLRAAHRRLLYAGPPVSCGPDDTETRVSSTAMLRCAKHPTTGCTKQSTTTNPTIPAEAACLPTACRYTTGMGHCAHDLAYTVDGVTDFCNDGAQQYYPVQHLYRAPYCAVMVVVSGDYAMKPAPLQHRVTVVTASKGSFFRQSGPSCLARGCRRTPPQ
jgi:hypothetical protein